MRGCEGRKGRAEQRVSPIRRCTFIAHFTSEINQQVTNTLTMFGHTTINYNINCTTIIIIIL